MSTLLIDPVGGLAGDMLLAALVDLGAPEEELRARIGSLPLERYTLSIDREVRRGFAGRRVRVEIDGHDHAHRTLADIRHVLERGDIGAAALERAFAIFGRLADAEARVHGVATDAVHFHEVGAIDAIVDIAGIAVALDLLGADALHVGTVPLGTGTTHGAHGEFPLPAPATTELLRGWPVRFTGRPWEHTTPTGAAVVSALARPSSPPAGHALGRVGTGFGTRENEEGPPNMTRVLELHASSGTGVVDVVEATLDDMSGEHVGFLIERFVEAGALDVFVTAVAMKKQRPGVLVTVLAERGAGDDMTGVFFAHSTTLGVRRREEMRTELVRAIETIETPFGAVRVKVAVKPDGARVASPEYDDARRVALAEGISLAEVYRRIESAWRAPGRT